jgi:hypothetical protein
MPTQANNANAAVKSLIDSGTQVALNSYDPDNFELYVIALELRDDDDSENPIKDYFVFPVNPDSIMRLQKTLANVKKSFGGVHAFDNESFVPYPISLSGNFGGSKLKILIGNNDSISIKTGFGATKKLQSIVDSSRGKGTQGKPLRLILHLLPFSESVTIIVHECRYYQNMSMNRIWQYDFTATAVAPDLLDMSDYTVDVYKVSLLQKFSNAVFNSVAGILTSIPVRG